MKRRLLNLAAAMSLLLFVATATLWLRSYHIKDRIEYAELRALRFKLFSIKSTGGLIFMHLERFTFRSEEHARTYARPGGIRHYSSQEKSWWPQDIGWLGSVEHYQVGSPDGLGIDTDVAIPYWLAVTVTTLLPVMWLVSRIRRRNRHGVFCPTCGYDLRATPDRCPECGLANTSVVPPAALGDAARGTALWRFRDPRTEGR